jgi:hypothetical protein
LYPSLCCCSLDGHEIGGRCKEEVLNSNLMSFK